MKQACVRWTPHVVAALAIFSAVGDSAFAAVISWNAGDGSWFNANHWTPNGIPDENSVVRIGNLPGVQDSTVMLGGVAGANPWSMEITDGMTVDLNGSEMVSLEDTVTISDLNSRLIVRPHAGLNERDFHAELQMGALTYLELHDGVGIQLYGTSTSAGTITGRGDMALFNDPFRNDGVINPSGNGGIVLSAWDGGLPDEIDLDGFSGNGHLQLNTPFSELEVNGSGLNDSFSGTISLVPGALLTMNMTDGWSADAGSVINVAGFNNPAAASQIAGDEFSFGGTLHIGAAEGHLRVLAPTTLQPSADVTIGDTDWLELDGTNVVLGGQYALGQGAQLDFDGPTTLQGGVFTTASNLVADGSVDFNASTTWDGNVTINGAARQNGPAHVTGATTINAGTFDMDGATGSTAWEVDANFIVNADQIDTSNDVPARFDGTIDVGGGFAPRLTVNLSDPGAHWVMDGNMNLSGLTHLFETRVAGSALVVDGDLNVTSGRVHISADMVFSESGGAHVHIGPETAVLRMGGDSVVGSSTVFSGLGTFQNGPAAAMTLADGVALGDVSLVNQGLLEIADGPGVASANRFENTHDGTWLVELGGYFAGTEHDVLLVGGDEALLDGIIEVALLDIGAGLFAPQIGDEFTVLVALDGISGMFVNAPITHAGGLSYLWSVQYGTHDVTLFLDAIVPEPASLALLLLGGFTLVSRRRTSQQTSAQLPSVTCSPTNS